MAAGRERFRVLLVAGLRDLASGAGANGATTARQTYREGLVSEWRGGEHRWPLVNALGTTTQLTDANEAVTDSYVLDAAGNPTSIAEQLLDTDNQTLHNATLSFGYDDINRLTLEKRVGYEPIWYEYTMDGAGNRTQFVEKDQQGTPVGTTNATYSADNRLLTYGNMTFGYDGNGNRTSKTVNQVTTTYAYNHDNRLTELHDGATLTFTYNADGLRQSRTVNGTTTQYAYDGVRLLKELDANGATETSYTLAPLGDEWYPLLSDRASGASRFYAFDALGTTRALTNQSQLTTHQFTDDAYGNLLSATDPTATPHQYIGRLGYYADAASGLQLLTHRYYDPAVRRFVTEDPVREGGNWHEYTEGNPATGTDPLGLANCWNPIDQFNDPQCPGYWLRDRDTWRYRRAYESWWQCWWRCAQGALGAQLAYTITQRFLQPIYETAWVTRTQRILTGEWRLVFQSNPHPGAVNRVWVQVWKTVQHRVPVRQIIGHRVVEFSWVVWAADVGWWLGCAANCSHH